MAVRPVQDREQTSVPTLTSNMDSPQGPTAVLWLSLRFSFQSLSLAMQKLCHQVAMWSHCMPRGIEVVAMDGLLREMCLYSSQKIIHIKTMIYLNITSNINQKNYNWGYLHCLFPNYLPHPAYEGVNAALP